LLSSCYVNINDSNRREVRTNTKPFFAFLTATLFPFENNQNWWSYSEKSGNHLSIQITDTISDNRILYYKVTFKEQNVDTSFDWFKRTSGNIHYSPNLIGTYDLFLPSRLDSLNGSFISGNKTIYYSFYDSLKINANTFHNVVSLRYSIPFIHNFKEIVLADSIGIVQLKDTQGRWPVTYSIDSCNTGSVKRVFAP
jgi:hypothetical protein